MADLGVALGGWVAADGVLFEARLRALGLPHGMAVRPRGNMKDSASRRRVAADLGVAEPLVLSQVHGTVIYPGRKENQGLEGDGWILGPGDEGFCVGVYVADCLPLFLWSNDGRYAGVFHVGWKGLAAGMPAKAVEALCRRGARSAELQAAFGPHIGVDAYRVGEELQRHFPSTAFSRRDDGLHLDMDAETRRLLIEAGIPPSGVGPAAPCTMSDSSLFHSFRRDKQDARMLAMIALKK